MELHGTLGPSRTSLSAVAKHAGVRRSTLYRHFPDEAALFAACSSHWMSQHPLPDLDAWAAVSNPDERLRRALTEIYTYYAETEPMLTNLLRDLDVVESVQRQFTHFLNYMEAARRTLMVGRERGRGGRARKRARRPRPRPRIHDLAVARARTRMHSPRGRRHDVPARRPCTSTA